MTDRPKCENCGHAQPEPVTFYGPPGPVPPTGEYTLNPPDQTPPPARLEPANWYDDRAELVRFGAVLLLHALPPLRASSANDLQRYYERPWDYTAEYLRWKGKAEPVNWDTLACVSGDPCYTRAGCPCDNCRKFARHFQATVNERMCPGPARPVFRVVPAASDQRSGTGLSASSLPDAKEPKPPR